MYISGAIIQRPQKCPQAAELRHPRWSGSSLCAIRGASYPGGVWPSGPRWAGHSRQKEERDPSLQAGRKSTRLCGWRESTGYVGPVRHHCPRRATWRPWPGSLRGGWGTAVPPTSSHPHSRAWTMVVPENAPFRTCQAEGQTVFPVSFRLDNRNLSCTRSADVQMEAYLQWLAFLDHSQALCSLPLQV